MPDKDCNHKYIHYDHSQKVDRVGAGIHVPKYTRIDMFYCEHCLDLQESKRSEQSWDRPDWYTK